MKVRSPIWAGRFYPAEPHACREMVTSYFERAPLVRADRSWIGGLVPHAGWICSAAIAAETISALARSTQPDVVVIFGAVHTPLALQGAALDSHEAWAVPTGSSDLAGELSKKLLEATEYFRVDERFHRQEHAVEVEVPLVQHAFPKAAFLPVEVAPDLSASEVGRLTALSLKDLNLQPIFLASSDLTHYGPDYRFTPAGVGPAALDWAMENDRHVLDLILKLEDGKIIPDIYQHHNACGGGAIAAMLAAAKEFGAQDAQLISHTNSFQTLRNVAPQPPTHSVGYASVVVG